MEKEENVCISNIFEKLRPDLRWKESTPVARLAVLSPKGRKLDHCEL